MSRKTTPDILGEIMGSLEQGNKAIKPANNKTLPLDNALKEKATFNLSVALLDQLEELWVKLRKEKRGVRVTKTLIVEKALQIAINDYKSKGGNSELIKKITAD